MSDTLDRWLERTVATRAIRLETAKHLGEPPESAAAVYLFSGEATDQGQAYEHGKARLSEFIKFAEKSHQQVQRLRDLVARVPEDPKRWGQFIEHELERETSAWKSCEKAARALAQSFRSEQQAGIWIARYARATAGLTTAEVSPAEQTRWKRRVFLALVDPIIARVRAQEGE